MSLFFCCIHPELGEKATMQHCIIWIKIQFWISKMFQLLPLWCVRLCHISPQNRFFASHPKTEEDGNGHLRVAMRTVHGKSPDVVVHAYNVRALWMAEVEGIPSFSPVWAIQ